MGKFKVGDKVKVKVNFEEYELAQSDYKEELKRLDGKVVTIIHPFNNGYLVEGSTYCLDEKVFEPIINFTKQEVIDMPVGTKIYTDGEEGYNIFIKDFDDCFNGDMTNIDYAEIGEDLTLANYYNEEFGTRIIKIEVPIYKVVYEEEIKEMTIEEIENELGYKVKIKKEKDNEK